MSTIIRNGGSLTTYVAPDSGDNPKEKVEQSRAAFKSERRKVADGARVSVDFERKVRTGTVLSTRIYQEITVCKVALDEGGTVSVSAGRVKEIRKK